jgi:hypothetical protein
MEKHIILYNAHNMHHKNLDALTRFDENIIFEHIQDFNDRKIKDKTFDAIYSPNGPFNINELPNHLKTTNIKYIFGPHFSVFPQIEQINPIIHNNSIYIQPSDWAKNVWQNIPIKTQTLPFCVNVNKFKPIETTKQTIFIYYKNREPTDLNFILKHFENQPITVFNYHERYNEEHYLNTLQHAKFGIWVGAHESQGFALEEALSCNVPLLVWNIKSMNQEYRSNYPPIPATTIPYWDETCGEVFYEKNEFIETLHKLECNLNNYKPREYILKTLSPPICQQRFVQLLN